MLIFRENSILVRVVLLNYPVINIKNKNSYMDDTFFTHILNLGAFLFILVPQAPMNFKPWGYGIDCFGACL